MKANKKKLVLGITAPLSVILLKGQLRFFNEKGYAVFLLAPETSETINFCNEEGAQLLPVPIEREISIFKDVISLLHILKHLYKIKPDVINVGTPKMGLLGLIGAWILRVPKRYYTCRGFRYEHESGAIRKTLILMERIASYCANRVICISPSIRKMGVDDGIFPFEKTELVGNGSSNGVDLNAFTPATISDANRAALIGVKEWDGKFIIGFVGRIVDRKGINELYSAFCNLQLEFDDIHLLIVGKANISQVSDPFLIDKMEKNKNVTLTGYINNVNEYMSVMNLFVMPAWWEGFGNTLIQAAATGLPIISCDATGCRDAVKDGFNGILVPPNAETELKAMMRKLILSSELRSTLGGNGLEWAKRFDSDEIWEGLHQLYLR